MVHGFSTFDEEIDFIAQYLQEVRGEDGGLNGVCVVARTNDLLTQYGNALREKGFDTYPIKRSEAEDRNVPGVRLATMHRVKGLEFDRIVIAGANAGIIPFEGPDSHSTDPTVRADAETGERSLLYVAATRAKKAVVVTAFGKPSRFLE